MEFRRLLTIDVPSRLNRQGVDELMSNIFDDDGKIYQEDYCFDFSHLSFIEPVGVVSIANTIDFLQSRSRRVFFSGTENLTEAICYLDDSGFFELYLREKKRDHAEVRGTTVPLQRVRWDSSHAWLENKFLNWLSAQLAVNVRALSSLKTCLSEIFNNINDHSGLKIGSIYMQHFPKRNNITIAMADFGVGVPYTIRRNHPSYTRDCDAILLASQNTITSKSTPGNRGAGLDFLISSVVDMHKGSVYIASGYGKLQCRHSAGRLASEASGFYPGTLIEIGLNTQTIVVDEEEEDLEW